MTEFQKILLSELRSINKSLNILATEVKTNREYKEAMSESIDKLHDQLNEFKNNPFGIK